MLARYLTTLTGVWHVWAAWFEDRAGSQLYVRVGRLNVDLSDVRSK